MTPAADTTEDVFELRSCALAPLEWAVVFHALRREMAVHLAEPSFEPGLIEGHFAILDKVWQCLRGSAIHGR